MKRPQPYPKVNVKYNWELLVMGLVLMAFVALASQIFKSGPESVEASGANLPRELQNSPEVGN